MSFFRNLFRGSEPEPAPTVPEPGRGTARSDDPARFAEWYEILRTDPAARPPAPLGRLVLRACELAVGSAYAFRKLDVYIREEGEREEEPLSLSLTHFEAVTLIESALALARCVRQGTGTWEAFGREVERLRYRGGRRDGYPSRLHYFSEWISDNAARGILRDMGPELGGVPDTRPLRLMTTHRSNYIALQSDAVFAAMVEQEKRLDTAPRWVVPAKEVPAASERIEPGDIVAFASGRRGLDVSHAGIAVRDANGALRVLQALFSANRVELSAETLPEHVASRRATGILVARPV